MFTRVGRGHPDVVAQPLAAGEHSARILADVQVARAVEREVVGRLEVERRIHAGTGVVGDVRCAVVAATRRLAQIDGEHPVFARDGDIQDVGATAIVARRRRELDGHRSGSRTRNTPTLINAALQPTQFADNRARTLEDQAADVMGSAPEMGGSLATSARAVRNRPAYRQRFARQFGSAPDTSVSGRTLRLAVAAYVRSLSALDSPFDRAVQGDETAMTAEAREGFTLFMGRAKCGTCHFAPLFNGALPPKLMENEPEVIGVPVRDVRRRATIDPDSGRFGVRRIDQHLHAFKTPTLRNVTLTAPYMHNGAFALLESVVDFYDTGGGAGIGARLSHQTLPTDSLRLTSQQKRAIVAFMRALTDTTGTTARPVR